MLISLPPIESPPRLPKQYRSTPIHSVSILKIMIQALFTYTNVCATYHAYKWIRDSVLMHQLGSPVWPYMLYDVLTKPLLPILISFLYVRNENVVLRIYIYILYYVFPHSGNTLHLNSLIKRKRCVCAKVKWKMNC